MSTMRVSLGDIASAIGRDKGTVSRWATTQCWSFTEVAGRGGRTKLFDVASLPEDVRKALVRRSLRAEGAALPAVTPAPPPRATTLRAHQRDTMEARAQLLAEVDRLRAVHDLSPRQAILALVEAAQAGTLRPDLASAVAMANARGGKSGARTLSRPTVYRWYAAREAQGVTALATRDNPRPIKVGGWETPLLVLRARPSNPSLAETLRDLDKQLPPDVARPSYDQARRLLASLSIQEREMGRRGPRAMVALRRYTGRDTSGLRPGDIYTADGKSVPVEVVNPLSGLPIRPEVTTVLDVATRRAVGWSVALSENTEGVRAAYIRSVLLGGVPAIWYTDNGPGFDNASFDAPLLGTLARAGTTNMDSLPDRSHSRGIIERFQQHWNVAAKKFPSYVGKDMDAEAKQVVFKRSRKELREKGASQTLLPWAEFLQIVQEVINTYNDRPHSSLPKIRDPATGRSRHQSPNEAWAGWVDQGWEPVMLAADDVADLARPMVERTTNRALVEIMGNTYYHPDLEQHHGERVAVSYDIHDANHVWVREIVRSAEAHRIGRLICIANWNAHTTAYVPVPVIEQARAQRIAQAVQRLEAKADGKRAEASGLIDHQPAATPVILTSDQQAAAEAMLAKLQPAPAPVPSGERPRFASDLEMARWLLAHPDAATPRDALYLRDSLRGGAFRLLCQVEEVDLSALDHLIASLRGAA